MASEASLIIVTLMLSCLLVALLYVMLKYTNAPYFLHKITGGSWVRFSNTTQPTEESAILGPKVYNKNCKTQSPLKTPVTTCDTSDPYCPPSYYQQVQQSPETTEDKPVFEPLPEILPVGPSEPPELPSIELSSVAPTDVNPSIQVTTQSGDEILGNSRRSSLDSVDTFLEQLDETNMSYMKRAASSDSIDSTASAYELPENEIDRGQIEVRVTYNSPIVHPGAPDPAITLVGQAKVRLKDLNLSTPTNLHISLLPLNSEINEPSKGEMLVSLNYQPTTERLSIVVSKIRDLRIDHAQKISHVFVRAYLVHGTRVNKKKTIPQPINDGSSEFNECMIFNLAQSKIDKVHLRLSLTSADGCINLGHVTIGSKRWGKQLGHWQQMIDHPRKPIVMWQDIFAKKAI